MTDVKHASCQLPRGRRGAGHFFGLPSLSFLPLRFPRFFRQRLPLPRCSSPPWLALRWPLATPRFSPELSASPPLALLSVAAFLRPRPQPHLPRHLSTQPSPRPPSLASRFRATPASSLPSLAFLSVACRLGVANAVVSWAPPPEAEGVRPESAPRQGHIRDGPPGPGTPLRGRLPLGVLALAVAAGVLGRRPVQRRQHVL